MLFGTRTEITHVPVWRWIYNTCLHKIVNGFKQPCHGVMAKYKLSNWVATSRVNGWMIILLKSLWNVNVYKHWLSGVGYLLDSYAGNQKCYQNIPSEAPNIIKKLSAFSKQDTPYNEKIQRGSAVIKIRSCAPVVPCSMFNNDHSHWISVMKIHEFHSWNSTIFSHEIPRFSSWNSTNFSHATQLISIS